MSSSLFLRVNSTHHWSNQRKTIRSLNVQLLQMKSRVRAWLGNQAGISSTNHTLIRVDPKKTSQTSNHLLKRLIWLSMPWSNSSKVTVHRKTLNMSKLSRKISKMKMTKSHLPSDLLSIILEIFTNPSMLWLWSTMITQKVMKVVISRKSLTHIMMVLTTFMLFGTQSFMNSRDIKHS